MSFKVEAIRLTKDMTSTKVAYDKNGKTYIRTGEDNFSVGKPSKDLDLLTSTWGFRKVDNPPVIANGKEMVEEFNKNSFSISNSGTVEYG